MDVGLLWNGIGITTTHVAYDVDNLPPTLTLDDLSTVVGPGDNVVYGVATDGEGGGVQSVEFSLDEGATWQPAAGTMALSFSDWRRMCSAWRWPVISWAARTKRRGEAPSLAWIASWNQRRPAGRSRKTDEPWCQPSRSA